MILLKKSIRIFILLFASILMLSSCMTWHQKNSAVHNHIQAGNIEKADKILAADKNSQGGKNHILNLLDRGVLNHMLGNYKQSIEFFKKADIIIEDYRKSLGTEALALITNPMAKPYLPEDFEVVLINFYQSMNYISLGEWDEAIVECRRANIKLNALNDKYKDHKNRYQQDAFIHLLMGLIYDAQRDYNNAFIAYRNAFEIFEKDYAKNFGIEAPEQLKKDLLRTAYKTGFLDEVSFYETKFDVKFDLQDADDGNLIFFWMNGLGPIKSEWSLTFAKEAGGLGYINFVNDEMGISFPYYVNDLSSTQRNRLEDLSITHIAFPKYTTRPPIYHSATLVTDENKDYPLELTENINAIAYKVLQDRMFRELGNSLLRVALKKAIENSIRNEDETLGFIVGLFNTATEKADTRNWQTLPFSISYCRASLPEGEQKLILQTSSDHGIDEHILHIPIKEGRMRFFGFHSIDSYPYAH